MSKRILRIILPLFIALVVVMSMSIPIYSALSDTITITNTPQFISISIAPDTYNINGADGKGAKPSTTYYTNPSGMETTPTVGGAVDGECAFTITNTSNVHIDLKVTSSDFAGGSDNSANSDAGTAAAATYGAKSYFSGQAAAAWEVAKVAIDATGYANLGETTNIKFGMIIAEQTNAWTGATPATFSVVVTASAA
jgi:hypothetical protein